jgi:hypothetical protein
MNCVFVGAGIAVLIGILAWLFNNGKAVGGCLLYFVGGIAVFILAGIVSIILTYLGCSATVAMVGFLIVLGGGIYLLLKLTGFQN